MSTKLTLTMEKEVVEVAKAYAKENGQSLSEIVESYFKLIAIKRSQRKSKHRDSNINKYRGIIKIDESIDYKHILEEELSKKYDI
ncbi:MAG: hypothetical protein H6553_04260 [Chitinophagales bacterium]|nr:hypothetical protein [Chitinophagales bacterium]